MERSTMLLIGKPSPDHQQFPAPDPWISSPLRGAQRRGGLRPALVPGALARGGTVFERSGTQGDKIHVVYYNYIYLPYV